MKKKNQVSKQTTINHERRSPLRTGRDTTAGDSMKRRFTKGRSNETLSAENTEKPAEVNINKVIGSRARGAACRRNENMSLTSRNKYICGINSTGGGLRSRIGRCDRRIQ